MACGPVTQLVIAQADDLYLAFNIERSMHIYGKYENKIAKSFNSILI
jgi:predicted phosphohydrolase